MIKIKILVTCFLLLLILFLYSLLLLKIIDQRISKLRSTIEDFVTFGLDNVNKECSRLEEELTQLKGDVDYLAELIQAKSFSVTQADNTLRIYLSGLEQRLENVEDVSTALYERLKKEFSVQTQDSPYSNPGSRDVALSQSLSRGRGAFEKKDYKSAVICFAEYIDDAPVVWEARYYYAWALFLTDPLKAAQDKSVRIFLEQMPEDYNKFGSVTELKGRLAFERGDYKKGQFFLEEALILNPLNLELKIHYAEAAFLFGDVHRAMALLEDALAGGSSKPEILYTMGRIYESRGDITNALDSYQDCLSKDSGYHKVYFRIGLLQEQLGAYAAAEDMLSRYLVYNRDPRAMLSLGNCLLNLKKNKRARETLLKVTTLFPESPEAEKADMLLDSNVY